MRNGLLPECGQRTRRVLRTVETVKNDASQLQYERNMLSKTQPELEIGLILDRDFALCLPARGCVRRCNETRAQRAALFLAVCWLLRPGMHSHHHCLRN
jgi:hypothetical protein